MDSASWERVKALFDRVVVLDEAGRDAYLAEHCRDDREVEREVRSLLAADRMELDRLETPAFEQFAPEPQPADSPPGRAAGEAVGAYQLVEKIGEGGMATVHRAVRADEAFDQEVAIKFLRAGIASDGLRLRFLNERQTLANLDHPYIARLLDGGEASDGSPYLVMEYVRGEPLLHYCERKGLEFRERLELFRKIAEAVAFAHRSLVVHRDLKPANILVTSEGTPKLLDFGIAKMLDAEHGFGAAEHTISPVTAMTPEYASPEQVRGEAITTASDVYSLGVLLYQMLAGRPPYELPSRSIFDIERVVCREEPPRPSALAARHDGSPVAARELAGDLDAIVLKALRKEPDRRYASVDAFLDDLERYATSRPVLARPDELTYRIGKYVRRHRLGVAAAAMIVVTVAAGFTAVAWQRSLAERAARRATTKAVSLGRVSEFLVGLFESSDPWVVSEAADRPVGAILEQGAQAIGDALREEPRVQAELRVVLGRVFLNAGRDEEALAQLDLAEEIARSMDEDRDELLSSALNWMGIALRRLHRFDAAVAAHEEAVVRARRFHGAASEELAGALNALGLARFKRAVAGEDPIDSADFLAAERALNEALLVRRGRDASSKAVAMSLSNIGAFQRDRANAALGHEDKTSARSLLEASIHSFRDALQLYEDLAGEDTPEAATTRNNLALTLLDVSYEVAREDAHRAASLREETERLFRRSIESGRAFLGPDHPWVATWLHNLGLALEAGGKYREAAAAVEQALVIARAKLKEDHPVIQTFEETLGAILERAESS